MYFIFLAEERIFKICRMMQNGIFQFLRTASFQHETAIWSFVLVVLSYGVVENVGRLEERLGKGCPLGQRVGHSFRLPSQRYGRAVWDCRGVLRHGACA